jgi:hypothetical protein
MVPSWSLCSVPLLLRKYTNRRTENNEWIAWWHSFHRLECSEQPVTPSKARSSNDQKSCSNSASCRLSLLRYAAFYIHQISPPSNFLVTPPIDWTYFPWRYTMPKQMRNNHEPTGFVHLPHRKNIMKGSTFNFITVYIYIIWRVDLISFFIRMIIVKNWNKGELILLHNVEVF